MSLLSAVPQGIYINTGNGQNALNWNIVAGATGYVVNRSTDGVNYTLLAMPTVNYYVDATCLIGVQYYYQVASNSVAGVSPFNSTAGNGLPLVITPCAPGQINLGYLRYEARLRCDQLKSNFCTNDEMNLMINQSAKELYGLLVQKYGEDYFLAPLQIFQTGAQVFYPLPNGTNFLNTNGMPDPNGKPAAACFKVHKMEVNSFGANVSNPTGWVPMSRCNASDLDKYNLFLGAASNYVSGQFCQFQYREMGTNVAIIPVNSGQYVRIWYVPLAADMLIDTDMLPYSYSGWHEYVVVDVAAKAAAKQENFPQAQDLMNKKRDLLERIETEAANRNVGAPNTATNSRSMYGDPNFGGGMFGTGMGGWNGGGYGY
jgi:hypothetical protein